MKVMMNLFWLSLSLLFACAPETQQKAQDAKSSRVEEVVNAIETDSNVLSDQALEVSEETIQTSAINPEPSTNDQVEKIAKEEVPVVIEEVTVIASPKAPTKDQVASNVESTTKEDASQTSQTKMEEEVLVAEEVIPAQREEVLVGNTESETLISDEPLEEKLEEALEEFIPTTHEKWQILLSKYVDQNGFVDYKGFKSDESSLSAYLAELSNEDLTSYSAGQKKAFYINAYNAFTIKLILDNYPLKSIIDLHGGKTWDRKWISLGGTVYSLNEIEHQLLIRDFSDSRVHFAINCAAKSCPPLSNKAFTSSNVESELKALTKAFLSNKAFNNISANSAELSKLFEWYAKDFGDVKAYINKYLGIPLAEKAKLKFKEYDWALNGK